MAEPSFEDFKAFLPPHLSPEKKETLFDQLRSFPANLEYYTRAGDAHEMAELLQGDGWQGFVAINFETLERKVVSGIILSNSCDIDTRNRRDLPVHVVFAPLMKLSRFKESLLSEGNSEQRADSLLSSIRLQRVSSLFYLPPSRDQEEAMALLSDVHGHPVADFSARERSRLFRLNQYGFYLFLFKLSIHFMRFQEDVDRVA